MAKSKEKTRWQLLAEAGTELNKVLGLVDDQGEPGIKVDKASEEELEEKLLEAMELITEDDEFTEQTADILETLVASEEEPEEETAAEDEDSEDEDEDEETEEPKTVEVDGSDDTESEEDEEFDADPEASIDNLIMEVKTTKKRKELRKIVQTIGILEPLVPQLPELKTSQVLKAAVLDFLDELSEQPEEAQAEEEPKETAASKKVTETKKPKEAKEAKPDAIKPKAGAEKADVESPKPNQKKKAPKKSSGKTKTQEAIEYITPFIEEGKYIERELSEMIAENTDTIAWATAHMLITKAKNPKYCKFDRVLQKDPNTNLVSFKND